MGKKLFETQDRDESHQYLEQVLREGKHPRAECREADENGMYSVWSGPHEREPAPAPPAPPPAETGRMHPADLSALADMLAARLKGG